MRLVLPFMAGIVVGWQCNLDAMHIVALFALSVVAMAVGMLKSVPRILFGVAAMVAMLSLGAFAEYCQSKAKEPVWNSEKQLYRARLLEVPQKRGTSVKVLAEVSLPGTVRYYDARCRGLVYLYFQRSVESDTLEIGDVLLADMAVSPPKNAGNPAEFDIESYYYIQGISGTAFVNTGRWSIEEEGNLTISMQALALRDKVVERYREMGLKEGELSLLSALTVGEKRDLQQEIKENYSAAGASHILALSGLHLGIIYAFLVLLLPLRSRKLLFVVLREAVIVLLLWGFAFVAGLSPSVVRAAILFTLMSAGRCLKQDSSSLSSLSFAAFAMLLFSPHLLFDISFQLSFAAVFSILTLAPPLVRLFRPEEHGRFYGAVVRISVMSLVAQVGTLPFIWYYFGVFPLYFLLTNIFIIPLAACVVNVAFLALVFSFVPLLQGGTASLLGTSAAAMNGLVELIAGLPGASFMLPPVGVAAACGIAGLLIMLSAGLLQKRWWLVAISLSGVVFFSLAGAVKDSCEVKGDRLVIYNNRKNPLLHAIESDGDNVLVSTVPQLDAEYEYSSSPYIKREGLQSPDWACWNYSSPLASVEEGLLSFGGLKIRLVDNSYWNENIYACPADIVVLCRGFLGSVEELLEVYPTECLVLDASLFKHSRERIMREAAALGIEPVDISRTGAVLVLPFDDSFTLEPLRGK